MGLLIKKHLPKHALRLKLILVNSLILIVVSSVVKDVKFEEIMVYGI